jgi:catechol 2,3-dioxygenase-like lactoylglutathione lyase family enzyme
VSGGSLILYATLGVADLDRAARFYDAVLATLGCARAPESDATMVGYGPAYDDGVSLWLGRPWDGRAPNPGNGGMVAFRAPSAAAVRAFHAAALAAGGTDEGAPGTRPYYAPSFYVAYVRDPDGNKLACVFHRHDPAAPG